MEKEENIPIQIIGKRKLKSPDDFIAIPNDLVDKYMRLFDGKQLEAVTNLIRQTFKAGLDYGRNESPMFAVIPMSILENKNLSANAKLLYGEIMALSKRSGKCYATNEHLANVLGLKKTTIPNLLRELSGCGLVIIDVKRNEKGTYRDIIVLFFNNGGHSNLARGGIVNQQGQKRNRQNRNKQRESRAFSPPSLSDVKSYCEKRQNNVNAENFINFYESKGWMVGKNKMKDWRAAIRTWENRIKVDEEEIIIPSYAKEWIK